MLAVAVAQQIYYQQGTPQAETDFVKTNQDPSWNYDLNGTDWNMGNCNSTSSPLSPIDLIRNSSLTDWSQYLFGFVPSFHASQISVAGIQNYVYQVSL